MRVVVFVAGGIAALIALAAIGLRVSERFMTKEEPAATSRKTTVSAPPPPTEDLVVHHVIDAGPRALSEGPLAFMASGHSSGVVTVTWIVEDGGVTISMTPPPNVLYCPSVHKTISPADLATLAAYARSIRIESMPQDYVRGSGHFASTMVSGGGQSFRITHPEPEDADDAGDVTAILALHERIERLAGTKQWASTCKRTETKVPFAR